MSQPCPEPKPRNTPHASAASFLYTRFTPRAVGFGLGGGGSSRSTCLNVSLSPSRLSALNTGDRPPLVPCSWLSLPPLSPTVRGH